MNARLPIIALLLLLLGLFIWRVEWDSAFLPARFNAAMTQRPSIGQAPPPGAVPFAPAASPIAADLLYRQYCAACHGMQGSPPPYLATYPGMPQITNLRTTPPNTAWADSIARGRGAMPAYAATLTPEQIQVLLHHITTLGQAASPTPQAHQNERSKAFIQAPMTHPAPLHFDWKVALATLLLSLPLGSAFVAALLPPGGGKERKEQFAARLLLLLASAGLAMGVGTVLWGDAGFAMPALSFTAGLALRLLLCQGKTKAPHSALLTLALSLSAYALAIPLLVGSYLPGKAVPSWYLTAHAAWMAALIILALLPHILPRCITHHNKLLAGAILLVLTGAHALLSLL